MDIRLSLERLSTECIDTSSDEEFDETLQLMLAAASVLHEDHYKLMSVYRG
jgi:hypothetical protein